MDRMFQKSISYIFALLLSINAIGQNQQNIILNTNQNPLSNTYIRATNSIKLQTNFKYSALNVGKPILNLSISTAPTNVGAFYSGINSASAPALPSNCTDWASGRTEKVLGETSGSFEVSPTGAATYTIPIFTSPGTADMQPSLSIVYNSQGGSGLFGRGADLAGLSAITRTGKTVFHDGKVGGIDMTLNDAYAFDGNRLFLLSGTQGADASTYYTESETFSTITAKGQQGNGPLWIEVKDKNGSIMQFGFTADSRLVGVGDSTVLSWKINKITDEFGNYISYTYKQFAGECVIDRIEYTGNAVAGQLPYNAVVFEYLPASDKNAFYFGGKKFQSTQIIKSITILAENQMAKKYVFDYDWLKGSSLKKVTEVDANGNEFYPTEFCWGDVNTYNPISTRPKMNIFQTNSEYTGLLSTVPADLNGDGFSDMVCAYGNYFKVMKNNIPANTAANPDYVDFQLFSGGTVSNTYNFVTANVCDENLDNKNEVYAIASSTSGSNLTYNIKKISANTSNVIVTSDVVTDTYVNDVNFIYTPTPFFYDVNDYTGDGIFDQVRIDPKKIVLTSTQANLTYNIPTTKTIVRPFEFNGDGVPEFITLEYPNNTLVNIKIIKLSLTPTPAFSVVYTSSISFPNNAWYLKNVLQHIALGDYNGDGKTDIAYLNEALTSLSVMYGTGNSFTAAQALSVFTSLPQSSYFLLSATDNNSDGKADLNITSSVSSSIASNFVSYISIGDDFIPGVSISGYWDRFAKSKASVSGDYITKADFNGDNVFDMVSVNDVASDFLAQDINGASYAVSAITSALYKRHIIKYMNINAEFLWMPGNSRRQIFTKLSTTTFTNPLYNYKPALYCVYESDKWTGVSNEIKSVTRYRYYDAIFHRNGRGFLGFEKTLSVDQSVSNVTYLGVLTQNEFNTSYYVPVLKNQQQLWFMVSADASNTSDYVAQPGMKTQRINTNSFTARNTKGYFFSVTQTDERDYFQSSQKTTSFTYDLTAAGRLKTANASYGWNGANISRTENVTNNYILNHGIQKLANTTQTGTQTGEPAYARTTNFNYDASGHLQSIVNDPTFGTQALTTTFSNFNSFGFWQQQTVAAGDVPTRTSQKLYDTKGRFVIKVTNALNDFEEYTYEPKFGNITLHKDLSGLITTFEYDGSGRKAKAVYPDGSINTIAYQWDVPQDYTYRQAGVQVVPMGIYSVKSQTTGQPYNKVYYSPDGAVIRNETTGLNGEVVVTDYKYLTELNAPYGNTLPYGLMMEATDPYYLGTQLSFLATQYNYDQLGREISNRLYKATLSGSALSYVDQSIYSNTTYSSASADAIYVKAFIYSTDQQSRAIKKESNTAGQFDKTYNINASGTKTETAVYAFHSCGKPKSITLTNNQSASTVLTTMTYNNLGQQSSLVDPSAGTINYTYNTLGELLTQTGANGTQTCTYDVLGRLQTKTGSLSGASTYAYVTAANGKEQIEKITGPNSVTDFVYDNLGRLTEQKETIGTEVLKTSYKLDDIGRISEYTYPGGFKTKNNYNTYGYLTAITDVNSQPIWQLNEIDAMGQIKRFAYGNGIETKITRTDLNYLSKIEHGTIHKQEYTFTASDGNLTSRKFTNLNTGITLYEEFQYDLDRLKNTAQKDPVSYADIRQNNIAFSTIGNITHKDDAGDYTYTLPAKPYTLTGINNPVTNISLNTLTLTYTDFNSIKQINEATTNKLMNFVYGNDNQRLKTEYLLNNVNQYTRYYAENYDKQVTGGIVKQWNYIFTPSGLAAVYFDNNGVGQLLYTLTDHLQSPVMLTNTTGQIVEQYSFDAWGRRRNPTDWSYTGFAMPQYLNRGYTFHEHIDEFGLINMNARLYDPVLGRFLQPDDYVQAPDVLQNFNRYGYVLNNPLKYTDPDGKFIWAIAAFILRGGYDMLTNNWQGWEGSGKPAIISGLFWLGGSTAPTGMGLLKFGGTQIGNRVLGNYATFTFSSGPWNLSFSPGMAFGTNGLSFAASLFAGYNDGTTSISGGYGIGSNYSAWGVSATYKGYGGGYYRTNYGSQIGPDGKLNKQIVGGINIALGDVGIRIENDFMGDRKDRWRSNAAEISYRNFSIGTTLYNNDPNGECPTCFDIKGTDRMGNSNTNGNGSWENGKVYSSPLYFGYKQGNTVSRIGYSDPMVQDRIQNWVHRNGFFYLPFGHQNFYTDDSQFHAGPYNYSGYYNPFTLWGR